MTFQSAIDDEDDYIPSQRRTKKRRLPGWVIAQTKRRELEPIHSYDDGLLSVVLAGRERRLTRCFFCDQLTPEDEMDYGRYTVLESAEFYCRPCFKALRLHHVEAIQKRMY